MAEKTEAYQLQHNIILPKNHMHTSTILTSTSMPTESEICSESHNNLPNLNFSSGESAFCLKSIISQEQLQQAREKIHEDIQKGKNLKETLKQSKKLSAGVIFKIGTIQLGKTFSKATKRTWTRKSKKRGKRLKRRSKCTR